MKFLNLVRFSVVLSMVTASLLDQMSEKDFKQLREEQIQLLTKDPKLGQVMCAKLSKEPYFRVDILFGPTWRIYYSWNMDLQKQCLDMVYSNSTPQAIRRFYNDMSVYLQAEPNWDAATVLVNMGHAGDEMLLIADEGADGRFTGVPNIVARGRIVTGGSMPPWKSIPLLKFQLKLMNGGKYLLVADCQIGVITLAARKRALPDRAEIDSIAESLDFGTGHRACESDENKNEEIRIK